MTTEKSNAPVLIVDDHEDLRELVRTRLEVDGYSVLEAEHGKAALDLLKSDRVMKPCLIVLDLEMPVMPGWELLTIIKSDTDLAQIPRRGHRQRLSARARGGHPAQSHRRQVPEAM